MKQYDGMRQYIIDFSKARSYSEFYGALKKGLCLPDWCGDGVDAIRDMLFSHVEYPGTITLIGAAELPERLKGIAETVYRVFSEAAGAYGKDTFIINYADAEGGE